MLEIRLLGQFVISLNQKRIKLASRPVQALFAYLVLNARTQLRRERLAGIIWPAADEKSARRSLRHGIWRIRHEFNSVARSKAEIIRADHLTVSFEPGIDCRVDTDVLLGSKPGDASFEQLLSAVSEYGGDLLPGIYDNWVLLERQRFQSEFDQRMDYLIRSLVRQSAWEKVIHWAERWIALGHVPEPAYRALLRAHFALGNLSNVAIVYKRCKESMWNELAVEPSEHTKTLYEGIINGDQRSADEFLLPNDPQPAAKPVGARTILANCSRDESGYLDVPCLSFLHAYKGEIDFGVQELSLILRSAVHHDLDLSSWISRANSSKVAVDAVVDALKQIHEARARKIFIESLQDIEDPLAEETLLKLVETEESARTRSAAALAAASHGIRDEVIERLDAATQDQPDPSAVHALAAIADELGLPTGFIPKRRIAFVAALLQRRWIKERENVIERTLRTTIGMGLVVGFGGLFAPLWFALFSPEGYVENLEVLTLPAWSFSGFLLGIVWGGLEGAVYGFVLATAGLLWKRESQKMRLVVGAVGGLFHGGFLVAATAMELNPVDAPLSLYLPALLLLGMIHGAGLSVLIPMRGEMRPFLDQMKNGLLIFALLAFSTIGFSYVAYNGTPSLFNVVRPITVQFWFVFGTALTYSGWKLQLFGAFRPTSYVPVSGTNRGRR